MQYSTQRLVFPFSIAPTKKQPYGCIILIFNYQLTINPCHWNRPHDSTQLRPLRKLHILGATRTRAKTVHWGTTSERPQSQQRRWGFIDGRQRLRSDHDNPSGTLAAHRNGHLPLLPSGPDGVHEFPLRKTQVIAMGGP